MCAAAATLTATYNDLDSVRQTFEANKDEIAGVILEPVVGNSGFIPPTQEFLEVCTFQILRATRQWPSYDLFCKVLLS